MTNFNLSNYGVNEISKAEKTENNGGFVAITIFGVVIASHYVAAAAAGIAIGAGIGVAAYYGD
ncbi:hypothetical protein I215_11753 [Galbibacter marinus]|uniref:Class IIb bacteriocin, lactobin A/cerein 7B family n=1 Tax=Galbibacter marinus TaxID=555500 RepID=K2P0E1_9FLAO|nr:hypothetical protein [Galbibacter marinus]EKF54523.1 hypothetical protein I215_11753 [Galbibacter marinus]